MPKLKPEFEIVTIGDCTLVKGDCLRYLEEVEYHSVDLVLTDPPYGINYKSEWSKYGYSGKGKDTRKRPGKQYNAIANDNDLTALENCLKLLHSRMHLESLLYCFCSSTNQEQVSTLIKQLFRERNKLIWDKATWGAGNLDGHYGLQYEAVIFAAKSVRGKLYRRYGDIIRVPRLKADKKRHPNEKPVELLERLIEDSTKSGDLVCDPFMGSGSTAVACVRTGRRFIGCEIDPDYFQAAVKRVEQAAEQVRYVNKIVSPHEYGETIG